MRRVARLICMAMIPLLIGICGAPAHAAGTGTIAGTVSDSGSNPLANMTVSILDPTWGVPVATTWTAVDGTYSIDMAPGTYRLQVSDPGATFADRFSGGPNGTSDWATSGTLVVVEGRTTIQDLTLYERFARVAGEVTGTGGVPLAGINVEARNIFGIAMATSSTAGDGSFALDVPAPNGFRVHLRDPSLAYGAAFHPGVTPATEATWFSAAPGDTIDASARLDPAGVLTGDVRIGERPAGDMIAALLDADTIELLSAVLTDAEGHYEFGGVRPGTYKVGIVDPTFLFVGPDRAMRPVAVPDHDLQAEGFVAALLAAAPYEVASGATTDVGLQRIVGADCDPTVFIDGADLSGTDLSSAHLPGCPITNADLTGADLTSADLSDADLNGTDLRNASLVEAVLVRAELSDLDLRGADLTTASFLASTDDPLVSPATIFSSTVCPDGATQDTPCGEWAQHLVVTHGGDDADSDSGDGVCQDLSGPLGACSLRAAISESNASPTDDAITFLPSVTTVTLSRPGRLEDANATGDLDVAGRVSITGDGVTIHGGGLDRVFHVLPVGDLRVDGATVTGGALTGTTYPARAGGGVFADGGDLTMVGTYVHHNGGGWGGGIAARSGSEVAVDRTTIATNSASDYGGGVYISGATATITTSTISSNTATTGGGGGAWSNGAMDIERSTVTANANGGLGRSVSGTTSIRLEGSVVASQASGTNCGASVTSSGFNLSDDLSCTLSATTDRSNANALLGGLTDNGGPGPTHLAYIGSELVDAIPAGTPRLCDTAAPSDQRGEPRPVGPACDIGAVEGTSSGLPPLHLIVDDPADLSDAMPGDRICDGGSGTCTLRAAIDEANAAATTDEITLTVDPIITKPAGDNTNVTGDLDTKGWLTIDGGGHTVDGNAIDRVLHVTGGVLTLTDVTITNGRAAGGGGIRNSGTLVATRTTIRGNASTATGGGLLNAGIAELSASAIDANTSSSTGGGIHSDGTLELSSTSVSDNTAGGTGGGIHQGSGTATLDQSVVRANTSTANDGGGLHVRGSMIVTASTIDRNVGRNGAGAYVWGAGGDLRVTASTIGDNIASGSGGGLGVINGRALLTQSTVSGNAAGATGGGISNSTNATLTIANATIDHNRSQTSGGGIYSTSNVQLTITASTVTNNTATSLAGAALYRVGPVTISGSVLASEVGTMCAGASTPMSAGFNVIGDTSCGVPTAGDQFGVDPLLAPLGDNGGPTRTELPYDTSPAVDAIPAGTPGLCDATTPSDQRGQPRPDGPACDAGATEGTAGPAPAPLDLTVDDPTDTADPTPGDGTCNLGPGTCTLRAAIDETNATPSTDTITLTVDPVITTPGTNDDLNATGDLDPIGRLTINGNNHTIDANDLDRALHNRANLLTITDTTITNGNNVTDGGGIFNDVGTLHLNLVTITNNTATTSGGGIRNTGTVAVVHSTISANGSNRGGGLSNTGSAALLESTVASNTASSAGGGIDNGSNASLSLSGGSVHSNTAATFGEGGGIYAAGAVLLDGATIEHNNGKQGGGVYANNVFTYSLTVHASTIRENNASQGGGLYIRGQASIASSSVSENTVTGSGGGIYVWYGVLDATALTVGENAASYGAGIYSNAGSVTLDASTVTANIGTGVFATIGSTLTIRSSTVVANQLTAVESTGQVTVVASTLAGPTSNAAPKTAALSVGGTASISASLLTAYVGTTCTGSGSVTSGGFNVVSDTSCGVPTMGDQFGVDPLLAPLADNGGPTQTALAYDTSPAVDAIPTGTPGLCDATTPTDQRGQPRPDGVACDAGATEGTAGTAPTPLALIVDDPTDTSDPTPGDGTCNLGPGTCTLRAAIDETNATPSTDTITLATDPTLTKPGTNDDTNATGDLDPIGRLTINGNNHTINANAIDRVLHNRGNQLTITDTTLTNGNNVTDGGGIFNDVGTLHLNLVTITNNTAAIRGGGVDNTALLDIEASTISQNTATVTGSNGGGIDNDGGTLHVSHSTVVRNTATSGYGGGINNDDGLVSIDDSLIAQNSGISGGGVSNSSGSLSITSSQVGENTGTGIRSYEGELTVVDSTVSANSGSGVSSYGSSAQAVITGTTITDGNGAGIAIGDGTADIATTTVSGNASSGVSNTYGIVTVRSSTINGGGSGAVANHESLTLAGSVLSAEIGAVCGGQEPLTSAGFNVIGDTSCGVPTTGDQFGVDPLLAPLADNGGPTQTALAYDTGPAVDAIPTGTPGLCDTTTPSDQRGQPRPDGVACDAGATEGTAGPAPAPLDLIVDDPTDTADPTPGDGSCNLGPGTCTLRAAIDETNATPSTDTITLTVDPVITTPGADEDLNATGDLDPIGRLTIHGNNHTIDANDLDRILHHRGNQLTVTAATFIDGSTTTSSGAGGAINNGTGTLRLETVTLWSNSADDGGGLFNAGGQVSIAASSITENTARYGGGIVNTHGSMAITGSTISGNTTWAAIGHGGGILSDTGPLTVAESTIANNTASQGGGIYHVSYDQSGPITIASSTIANNTATDAGGGFFSYRGPTSIVATTISGNQATAGGSAIAQHGQSSIAASVLEADIGSVCDTGGTVTSGGYNVVGDSSCDLTDGTDQTGIDPQLMTLDDNGGTTRTVLPHAGSPAVDIIPNGTPGLCDGSSPTDQRGTGRPLGAACDAGAVEGQGAPIPGELTMTVTSISDARDYVPGNGVCGNVFGVCTLRAAIDEANVHPGHDTIILAADPVLWRPGKNEDANSTGDLDVTGRLTIVGNGHTIDINDVDRVFHHRGNSLILDGLTITDGTADIGGAIKNETGTLRLAATNVTASVATTHGGGVYSIGALEITGGTVSGNTSSTDGGGILAGGRSVRIEMSSLTGNAATNGSGGAAYAGAAAVTISNATMSTNTALQYGGGLFIGYGAIATISGATVAGNTAATGGGVYLNQNDATLSRSTVEANSALRGGGIAAAGGTLTLESSTVRGNTATPATAALNRRGGGILNESADVAIIASTISDNAATDEGGGLYSNTSSQTSIARSTFVDNTAMPGSGSAAHMESGGSMTASILSADDAQACRGPYATSHGYNVVSDSSCLSVTNPTDSIGTSALLGPIADNGGPNWTHLPDAASPAVDRIPTGTTGVCDATVPVDQRGLPRPQGSACDSGAVER